MMSLFRFYQSRAKTAIFPGDPVMQGIAGFAGATNFLQAEPQVI